jgi:hypothetical protein
MRVRSLRRMVNRSHDFPEGIFTLSRSDPSHAHFLNLPRYGSTGKVISNAIGKGIAIVVQP